MKKYLFALMIYFIGCANSFAILDITISQGTANPTPIALNYFASSDFSERRLADRIRSVVQADLERCGFFKIISPDAFIEEKTGVAHTPLFQVWRQINATVLLNASVKQNDRGKYEVSFILWDSYTEKDIAGEIYNIDERSWRRVAHKIADKIYERITGNLGYFDTRVAYISEIPSSRQKIKRLAIMDQDGENHHYLTDGKSLVLTPRFSPKADKILYLSYVSRKPRVYLRDLYTGREKIVGDFHGMSFAPRFSPNGTKAVMSVARGGATNILEIDLHSMRIKALTNSVAAINTSPNYSPDGRHIVFNSDRGGSRQLYVMDVDGSDVKRISFGDGSYAAPVWSPKGDYIAFTKSVRGEGFYIGVMRPDGTGERIIAQGYLVESPSWAPNGRVIMYTKEERPNRGKPGKSKIYAIDITGNNEYELKTPHNASDPEWSKLLD
ncbi:MAG: tolB [Rickettsiaceae bacterium]|jgi:TolB protein|nr:tolB [Rickettsiaceae bacterium]